MLKIFTTQLMGTFNKIQEQEEMMIEDISRVFTQVLSAGGTLYFHGVDEMQAVSYEAVYGAQTLPATDFLIKGGKMAELIPQDGVVLATRFSEDQKAADLAKEAREKGAVVIGISATRKEEERLFVNEVDFHLDTKQVDALVPGEDGNRVGFPSAMAALYCYFALFLTTTEILQEHELDL
ncbi:DUF2529 family protein [Pseudalkalibacillus caeni]|nr:DUF2529 family protein [Pseudalkalibacillus caeni]